MQNEWWKTFFDEHYIALWGIHGMFKHTPREVNFLVKNIPLKEKNKILDLCCGHGRHSIGLARRGFEVVGLDYSAYELDLARKEAGRRHLDVKFIKGDARTFRSTQQLHVINNKFTAFGYGREKDYRQII
ncbi:MAG: methyltransferase domain-containing protein, partial [Candidatus Curtissbacteria bacterium]|nr:methyltransferase domain-containing protein [Candidatus Curtissbacteria bacterium]